MTFLRFKRKMTINAAEEPAAERGNDLVPVQSAGDCSDIQSVVLSREPWKKRTSTTQSLEKTNSNRAIKLVAVGFVAFVGLSVFAVFTALMPEYMDLFKDNDSRVPAMQHLSHSLKLLVAPAAVSNVELALDEAVRKSRSGDHVGAIQDYERLKIAYPSARLYNNLAANYEMVGNKDKAVDCYNKALEINPDWPMSLLGRGELYLARKNYSAALTDLNKAIKIGYPQGYFYRAQLYEALGKTDLAQRDRRIIERHNYKDETFTVADPPGPDEQ